MDQITVGMCQLPTWERVGTKAGMDKSKSRLHGGVAEVRVEFFKLPGSKHSLVNNRAGGQA